MSDYLVVVAGSLDRELDINRLPEEARKLHCKEGKVNGPELFKAIDDLSAYVDISGNAFEKCINALTRYGVLSKSGSSIYTILEFDEPIEVDQFTFVYIKTTSSLPDRRLTRPVERDQSDLKYIVTMVKSNIDSFTVRVTSSDDQFDRSTVIAIFRPYSKCDRSNINRNIHIMIAMLCSIFMYEDYEIPKYSEDARANNIKFFINLNSFYTAIEHSHILDPFSF
jgi:hypothetical protein